MDSKLSRWCDGLLEVGWLAAIIAVPLFFNIHSERVFEPDKLTLLRSIALIMSAAWLVKFIDQAGWGDLSRLDWRSKQSIWRLPFILPVFLLVVIYLISTAFSVTQRVSWAGSYQRLQGTYTTLSYITIFALMIATLRGRRQLNRVISTVIITSIPVALYAMLQRLGHDPLPWGGDVQRRVAGHMGNAIFIAAYLIMAVPPTAARIIDAFSNILGDEELSYADVIRSSIYIFALAIQLLAIYWTSSRGPWIGLGIGMFAFILILLVNLRNSAEPRGRLRGTELARAFGLVLGGTAAYYLLLLGLVNLLTNNGGADALAGPMGAFVAFAGAVSLTMLSIFVVLATRRGWRWLWLSWITLSLLVAVWLAAFNLADRWVATTDGTPVAGDVVETLAQWRDLPAIGRLGRLLEAEQGTGKVRVLIWQGVLDLISFHEPLQFPGGGHDQYNFLRPFIGYGPESMYVAYNRFYPPELATVEARNASPDRSHNETFDALVITGAVGFVAWQLLYLSVFYYSFRWLGVVRSRRDRYVLIGLWVGGAIVATLLLVQLLGDVYVGVAIPFGSIGGLVIYLIYYALFTGTDDELAADHSPEDPFSAGRLLMVALVAAVAAHYIEIHFGIAIAATRLHFFVYVGLLFLMGRRLTGDEAAAAVAPSMSKRRRGRLSSRSRPSWMAPVMLAALMLGLMVAILSFNFINLAPRPGETFTSAADVPQTFELIQRSFLERAGQASPYIFMLILLSWGLGALIHLTEMNKQGILNFATDGNRLVSGRRKLAAGLFLLMSVLSLLALFILPTAPEAIITASIGRILLLMWSLFSLWTAIALLYDLERAHLMGGAIALLGLSIGIPILFIGNALIGGMLAVAGIAILYLLWDKSWSDSMAPVLYMVLASLGVGFVYALLHAARIRRVIFTPPGVTEATPPLQVRAMEADQAAAVLTLFYLFIIGLLIVAAIILMQARSGSTRQNGTAAGLVSLLILLPVSFYFVSTTNMRIVQADIVYKRAKPWEQQATQARDPNLWAQAIAVYEHAIDMAPDEDFYYLFLGRSYLEQSALIQDPAAQEELLATAESRLKRAQEINPLNTDHTANLARLNVRWAQIATGAEQQAKYAAARSYYEDALSLSPQNAVIWNEYAGIAFTLGSDCEEALSILNTSAEVDPFYVETKLRRADIYLRCAEQQPETEQVAYYHQAADSLKEALESEPDDVRVWQQLAQVYSEIGEFQAAIDALEAGRQQAGPAAVWQYDYLLAVVYQQMGEPEQARELAQRAREGAPLEQQGQIDALLLQLGPVEGDVSNLGDERPLASLDPAARHNYFDQYPPLVIDTSQRYEAVIQTANGEIRLRLFDDQAPLTVNSFVFLASQGFYDGVTFHRVLPNFMAQGGDPLGNGGGGPGYQFPHETSNDLTFDRRGLLAMANAGRDTNGSQFFITFGPQPQLNGDYTIFGELIAGDEVLSAIQMRDPATAETPGDVIERIDIVISQEG